MRRFFMTLIAATGLAAVVGGQVNAPGDWPQWRGPDRTGLSKETGLLAQWPPAGPPVVWSISSLGAGFGAVATKGTRLFVQGSNGRQSVLFVLNRTDGKGLWSKA